MAFPFRQRILKVSVTFSFRQCFCCHFDVQATFELICLPSTLQVSFPVRSAVLSDWQHEAPFPARVTRESVPYNRECSVYQTFLMLASSGASRKSSAEHHLVAVTAAATAATGYACRIEERIKTEKDPDKKLKLRRFSRGLKTAHEDIVKFSNFYAKFEAAEEGEYEAIVAGNEDILMSAGFFDYLGNIATAAADDKERAQQIIATGQRIAAIHEAYARAALDEQQMALAQEKLLSVLEVCLLCCACACPECIRIDCT
jgi:hypothetical protein